MEQQVSLFNRGDRVKEESGYYGIGTVRYLDGDLVPDESGRHYQWPDQVCVEFDREINGEKPFMWCYINKLRVAVQSEER